MTRFIKVFYINILIIFCTIISIQANCNLHLPTELSLRPNVYKSVGFRKIKVNKNYVILRENQEIVAHCDLQFEEYRSTNQLFVKCASGYIYTKTNNKESYSRQNSRITLTCSEKKWKLYESSVKFTWCPSYTTPYYVGRFNYSLGEYKFLAGICYDLSDQSLSSVYYTLAPKFSDYEKPSNLDYRWKLDPPPYEIDYITEYFDSKSITNMNFDNQQLQTWITYSNYEYSSIIQMPKLNASFNLQFSPLLEFAWWQHLRLNNWKHYEDALEKHIESENQAYDILAGVSGTVKAPIYDNCHKNYTMKEVIDNAETKIPLYVWNYLQASDNYTNEFVIIGFNSPFNEFYTEEEIIFCPDKCQEIAWLKETSSSFRYSVMGIVFCCNVEDVKSSKRLHGFPENDLKTKPIELPITKNISNHSQVAEKEVEKDNEDEEEQEEESYE